MEHPRSTGSPTEPPAADWPEVGEHRIDYRALPRDDYLAVAHRADLELARRELAACRRPVIDWNHDLTGPTEAWRTYLAFTDPEWSEYEDAGAEGVAA